MRHDDKALHGERVYFYLSSVFWDKYSVVYLVCCVRIEITVGEKGIKIRCCVGEIINNDAVHSD